MPTSINFIYLDYIIVYKIEGTFCKILVPHTGVEDSGLLEYEGMSFGISQHCKGSSCLHLKGPQVQE